MIQHEDVIEQAREDATEVVTPIPTSPGTALRELVDRLASDDRADYLDKAEAM